MGLIVFHGIFPVFGRNGCGEYPMEYCRCHVNNVMDLNDVMLVECCFLEIRIPWISGMWREWCENNFANNKVAC